MASSTTSAPPEEADPVLPELPEAAVAVILRHVPLQQRLNSCALVCRAWAAAAAAATAEVEVWVSRNKCKQLEAWLGKHGGVVQRLTARCRYGLLGDRLKRHPLQLPAWQLVQLRSLDLFYFSLRLTSQGASTSSSTSSSRQQDDRPLAATGDGIAALLPQLQELTLTDSNVTMWSLSQILSSTALSKLHMRNDVLVYDGSLKKHLTIGEALPSLWQQLQGLPNLSDLLLPQHSSLSVADIAPLSNLCHLQSLKA